MIFEDAWNLPTDTLVKVSNGLPPPSTNTEGVPYNAWRSHNFTGTLEEKIERAGWRYLRFEVLSTTTPEQVVYLAYEIAEGQGHTFEVQDA